MNNGSTTRGSSRIDEHGDQDVIALFQHLSDAIISDRNRHDDLEPRLWHLPEIAAYYARDAINDSEKQRLEPLVHALRLEAATLIERHVDRRDTKAVIETRLRSARRTLSLRPWNDGDVELFAALLDNPNVWRLLPEAYPGPITRDVAAQLIAISNDWPARHVVRAVVSQGTIVGQARLQFDSTAHPESAEISYWLGEPHWGKGLGTDIVTLFTAWCFDTYPRLQRIFARVLERHASSVRVLAKSGYRQEAFRFHDVRRQSGDFSTHILAVCRSDYSFAQPVVPPKVSDAGNRRCMAVSLAELATEFQPVLEWLPCVA